MASSLPFNEMMRTASIPKKFELNTSLWGSGTCSFTVINFRDEEVHKIEVRVTKIYHPRFSDTQSFSKTFEVEGIIIKIDGKDWGPPADEFKASYREDIPEASFFEVINRSIDPLPTL